MNKTLTERAASIRAALYKNGYLFAAFLIPVLLMYGCYAVFGMYPYGENSVLVLDLNAQYVYYYDYMYDVIHNGESLFYSWSRNLSGEFFGIIGYYLASPFNFIVWLFPREMITDGLMYMILAKLGACGLTAALYLHKGRGLSKNTAVIFAPMYALCAFSVVQTANPMWLDGVMALPLICWGVESLVKHNRFRLLTAALIYSFVTNFYIGFMTAIFAVIYFIATLFANDTYDGGIKPIAKRFAGKTGIFALSGAAAALCSSFMLIPVYYSLQNGKFDFTVPDFSLTNNFELIDVFRKLFVNSYDTVRMEGMPFIFCGSITLVLAGIYFFSRRIPLSRRLASAGVLAALVLSMYVKPLDMLWHGGQVPNWLPYRYSFMISLILVVCAASMFEKLGKVKPRAVALSVLFFILMVIITEGRDTFITTLGDGTEVFDSVSVALPAIVFLLVAAVAVLCAGKQLRKNKKLTSSAVIMLVAVGAAELSFNVSNTLTKMDDDIVFSEKSTYVDVIPPLREKVNEIKSGDNGFYRIEKDFYRTVNDPIAVGMYGLSHSSSTLNAKAINMLGYFGFTSNGHYTRFSGYTPLTADIFGVKYILSAPTGRDDIKGDPDKITYTTNADALPIAYLTDNGISQFVPDKYTPFTNQTDLLTAMTGVDCSGIYTDIPAGEPVAKNCTMGNFADNHIGFTDAGEDASVTYTITTPKDGDVYMYIPTDYEREVYLYVNGAYKDVLFESDNHNIKLLGNFKANEQIEVRLDLNRSDLYYKQPQFAVYDSEAEQAAIDKLNTLNADTDVRKVSGTEVDIYVNSDGERTLFTTIPDEKGWEIWVDGEKSEYTALIDSSLIALNVGAGEHEIVMKFTPAGYPLAIFTTLGGILIFAAMIILSKKISAPVKIAEKLKAATAGEILEPQTNEDTQEEKYEDDAERFSELEQLLNSREKKEKKDDPDS